MNSVECPVCYRWFVENPDRLQEVFQTGLRRLP